MTMQEEAQKLVEERRKRADVRAEDVYDLEKLQEASPYLLDCSIQEEKDTLLFTYKTGGCTPFTELCREDILIQYTALIDAGNLVELHDRYDFSMCPENLYYDINAKVKVGGRDLCEEEDSGRTEQFLKKYKALIGAVLQKHYSYEDYIQGGMDLLQKKQVLSEIYHADSPGGIREILFQKYAEQKERRQKYFRLVHKQKYTFQAAIGAVMSILTVLLAAVSFYAYFNLIPDMKAVISANESYYDSDFVSVIDDLKDQRLSRMDIHTKCILATAYVKSENLSVEQKENILSMIKVTGNEKYINYWIELGRGNFSEAENIAMQISDDELLLYAYMKEKNRLEADDSISGEEKASRLAELQRKIDELAEEYSE